MDKINQTLGRTETLRTLRAYPTSSDTAVEIFVAGAFRELDVHMIRYKINSGKVPLFNYNSRWYTAVAEGNSVVSGILGINFVVFGYLYGVIELARNVSSPKTSQPVDTPNKQLAEDLTKWVNAKTGQNIVTPEYTSATQVFDDTKKATAPAMDSKARSPLLYNSDDIGLRVTIGTDPMSSLMFEKIRFLDSEVAVDAKSGDPIMELYTFMGVLGYSNCYYFS